MSDDRQRERLEEIKYTNIECTDLELVIKNNKERARAVRTAKKEQIVE